eukprot:356778-Chlamydomonas_euryale.AAC.9
MPERLCPHNMADAPQPLPPKAHRADALGCGMQARRQRLEQLHMPGRDAVPQLPLSDASPRAPLPAVRWTALRVTPPRASPRTASRGMQASLHAAGSLASPVRAPCLPCRIKGEVDPILLVERWMQLPRAAHFDCAMEGQGSTHVVGRNQSMQIQRIDVHKPGFEA